MKANVNSSMPKEKNKVNRLKNALFKLLPESKYKRALVKLKELKEQHKQEEILKWILICFGKVFTEDSARARRRDERYNKYDRRDLMNRFAIDRINKSLRYLSMYDLTKKEERRHNLIKSKFKLAKDILTKYTFDTSLINNFEKNLNSQLQEEVMGNKRINPRLQKKQISKLFHALSDKYLGDEIGYNKLNEKKIANYNLIDEHIRIFDIVKHRNIMLNKIKEIASKEAKIKTISTHKFYFFNSIIHEICIYFSQYFKHELYSTKWEVLKNDIILQTGYYISIKQLIEDIVDELVLDVNHHPVDILKGILEKENKQKIRQLFNEWDRLTRSKLVNSHTIILQKLGTLAKEKQNHHNNVTISPLITYYLKKIINTKFNNLTPSLMLKEVDTLSKLIKIEIIKNDKMFLDYKVRRKNLKVIDTYILVKSMTQDIMTAFFDRIKSEHGTHKGLEYNKELYNKFEHKLTYFPKDISKKLRENIDDVKDFEISQTWKIDNLVEEKMKNKYAMIKEHHYKLGDSFDYNAFFSSEYTEPEEEKLSSIDMTQEADLNEYLNEEQLTKLSRLETDPVHQDVLDMAEKEVTALKLAHIKQKNKLESQFLEHVKETLDRTILMGAEIMDPQQKAAIGTVLDGMKYKLKNAPVANYEKEIKSDDFKNELLGFIRFYDNLNIMRKLKRDEIVNAKRAETENWLKRTFINAPYSGSRFLFKDYHDDKGMPSFEKIIRAIQFIHWQNTYIKSTGTNILSIQKALKTCPDFLLPFHGVKCPRDKVRGLDGKMKPCCYPKEYQTGEYLLEVLNGKKFEWKYKHSDEELKKQRAVLLRWLYETNSIKDLSQRDIHAINRYAPDDVYNEWKELKRIEYEKDLAEKFKDIGRKVLQIAIDKEAPDYVIKLFEAAFWGIGSKDVIDIEKDSYKYL